MAEVEMLLRDYGSQRRPITVAELEAHLESSRDAEAARSAAVLDRVTDDRVATELMVWDFEQPEPNVRPSEPRRRIGLLAAVAAAVLVVVGMVVIADRDRDAPVTAPISPPAAPASAPAVTEPLAPPESVVPDTWPGVVDSRGYRWSRVPHDETVFSGVGAFTEGMKSVTAGGPGFVAVGATGGNSVGAIADAVVWTSVDGITWSRVPHDDAF
jgi:hypothetical protein